MNSIGGVWQPLYLGSLLCAIVDAIIGYAAMRGYWRWYVVGHYKKRQERRQSSN